MNVYLKNLARFVLLLILSTSLGALAQTTPTTNPPNNGSISTPLYTGSVAQVKNGDLSVNAFSAMLTSYFAQKLGVGRVPSLFTTLDVNPIVTTTSDLKNIQSGVVYNGTNVMTNYYGTYISAPTGSGTITNKYALVTEANAGKVGFGTITPGATLSVSGGVQMGNDASTCTPTNAGTLRLSASTIQICTGLAWTNASYANPCQPTTSCSLTASGGTCTTYETQTVPYNTVCPAGIVSSCSNGRWAPTPKSYSTCTVSAQPIYGCTDPSAVNYNYSATVNDGSCYYGRGCMDPSANNYDPRATINEGCTYDQGGCTDPAATNYNPAATYDDGSCTY